MVKIRIEVGCLPFCVLYIFMIISDNIRQISDVLIYHYNTSPKHAQWHHSAMRSANQVRTVLTGHAPTHSSRTQATSRNWPGSCEPVVTQQTRIQQQNFVMIADVMVCGKSLGVKHPRRVTARISTRR